MDNLIRRADAIKAVHEEFDECCVWDESGETTADEVERILECVPSAQPFHNITMNDVLKYIDSMPEDVWQEFTACLECRGWELQRRTTKRFCMSDLIERQAATDEIEYELEMINSALDSITLDFNARERLRQRRGEAREILNSIQQLPSAQPEPREVVPHRNYQYLSDYWCECGWHLGKKDDVKYCPDCGRKVIWDGSD